MRVNVVCGAIALHLLLIGVVALPVFADDSTPITVNLKNQPQIGPIQAALQEDVALDPQLVEFPVEVSDRSKLLPYFKEFVTKGKGIPPKSQFETDEAYTQRLPHDYPAATEFVITCPSDAYEYDLKKQVLTLVLNLGDLPWRHRTLDIYRSPEKLVSTETKQNAFGATVDVKYYRSEGCRVDIKNWLDFPKGIFTGQDSSTSLRIAFTVPPKDAERISTHNLIDLRLHPLNVMQSRETGDGHLATFDIPETNIRTIYEVDVDLRGVCVEDASAGGIVYTMPLKN